MTDKPKDLHFILTAKYYDEISRGEKTEEYRECEQWRKRIEGREYRNIVFHRGYTLTAQAFPYRGYEIRTITHPHFGPDPVTVYVLPLSTAQADQAKGEAGEPTK